MKFVGVLLVGGLQMPRYDRATILEIRENAKKMCFFFAPTLTPTLGTQKNKAQNAHVRHFCKCFLRL